MRTTTETMKNRSRSVAGALVTAAVASFLVACGGGSDGPVATQPTVTPATLKTGVFIDSPVSGITWHTETNGVRTGSGTTNAAGQFKYRDGDKITFSLGKIIIGSANAAPVVHVDSITVPGASQPNTAYSTRVGQFLQSLDKDSQQAGIDLTAVKTAKLPENINFKQAQQAFDRTLKATLQNAGIAANSFVSATKAREHLNRHKPTATPTTVPATATPTAVPATATPTTVPATATPTTVPVTATPTTVPATATPTTVPVTATPTTVPVTATPTTVPATATPTTAPATATPTTAPATATPTTVPATATPTTVPATATPTTVPVTATPTTVPATATPTTVPVTVTPTTVPAANHPDFASCLNASTASDPDYTACMTGTYTGKTLTGESCTLTYDGPNKGMRYNAGTLQAAAKAGNFDRPNYNYTKGSRIQTWINYSDDKTLTAGELFITSAYFEFLPYQSSDLVIEVSYKEAGSTKGRRTKNCIIKKAP